MSPHNCFACGTLNAHGLHLVFHVEQGRSWTELTLDRAFEGWEGIAHGGIVCTILDEVMAWALVGADNWGWSTGGSSEWCHKRGLPRARRCRDRRADGAPPCGDRRPLVLAIGLIAAIYWAGVIGMRSVRGSPPLKRLGQAFAHTLIPIGLAYLVAHYFSYFVFGEQAQFTTLLSDPLGNGSDYFGTRTAGIDYTILSATAIWYLQVGALVSGHVIGLTLAHDRAITVYGDVQQASRSQRWMLAVMVCFTSLGLFLLSRQTN